MKIASLGDSALLVRLSDDYDPERTSAAVLDTLRRLEAAAIPGVIELAPAYTTVAVFFDPLRALEVGAPQREVFSWMESKIQQTLERARSKKSKPPTSRIVEIPVCYDAEFALDLAEVARHANRSPEEAIHLHTTAKYRVTCLGFTPGFPFLSGLPPELATPRRATPRKEVPAGSVAIGGAQTGIYPLRSPGGWHLIGRTPLTIFDFKREPPALLRVGDHVRFRAITRQEFEVLLQK